MSSSWHKGYKEVKNTLHNDIGITKEEILDVFRQIAKDEAQKIVVDNSALIYQSIREIIKSEMINAVENHDYPKVRGHLLSYRGNGGHGIDSFKDYVTGVMKEEIINEMRKQFDIELNIDKKS
jgi:hypothetical protein